MKEANLLLVKALHSHFQAKRDRAQATLDLYLKNSVGVGEHPDVLDDMIKVVEELVTADECLKLFKTETTPSQLAKQLTPNDVFPKAG
jgi:hypothetical protein